jgi:hypothetical protein
MKWQRGDNAPAEGFSFRVMASPVIAVKHPAGTRDGDHSPRHTAWFGTDFGGPNCFGPY